ncbi:hypothetical protein ACNQFZ_00070 [Schinkia sp. CFF1]
MEAFGVEDSVVVLAVSVVEDLAGVLAVLAVLAALEASLFKHCFDCSKLPGNFYGKEVSLLDLEKGHFFYYVYHTGQKIVHKLIVRKKYHLGIRRS